MCAEQVTVAEVMRPTGRSAGGTATTNIVDEIGAAGAVLSGGAKVSDIRFMRDPA